MSISSEIGTLIPKTALARQLGVSSRTLSRWLIDDDVGFPRPIVLRGRNYFDAGSVETWKSDRLRALLQRKAS